ncbi:10591_t:CDS:2, partial [Scutellospora calospora]
VLFNVIENIDFQAFLKKACPSFNIPSHHTFSNSLLDKEYMNLQVVVQNTLDKTPYHFCTKEEHHTVENIAKGIENVMREINIEKCWAHRINFWVKDILKNGWALQILKKTKELVLYFRNHQISMATLRHLQKETYSFEIALVLTVDTRWISTFECLDHVLRTQAVIYAILTEDGIELDENIKAIISNEPYLSSAYKILQDLKKKIINNVQILVELHDNTLQLHIYLILGVDNENQVLDELAEYTEKSENLTSKLLNWWNLLSMQYLTLSQVVHKVLSISATSAASEPDKLVYIYWNTQILYQLGRSVLINNLQEISVNSDNQELDINMDDDENEELNGNFTDFSNWHLNIFDNCEHEFDNYSE